MHALLLRLRSLARSPGYSAAAILTLAVGIGAGTAVFSVFSHVLLKPLPYPEADRLVQVNSTRGDDAISMNYRDLVDLRESATSLDDLAAFARVNVTATRDGPAEQMRALAIESRLFPTLGVAPALGRPFRPEEDVWPAEPTVLLSHGVWSDRYGADPQVLGRTMLLDNVAHTIVGVMPPGFAFPDGIVLGSSDLWVPLGTFESITSGRDSHPGIYGVGTLAGGRTVSAARRELQSIAARLEAEYPDTNEEEGVEVRPALETVVGDVASALWIVLGGALLILLIACINVTNLLLARAVSRHRELAVRNALGAGTRRIVSLVLAESLVLSSLGAALGLGIGWALVRASALLISDLPRGGEVTLDLRVVAFATLLAVVSAALAGGAPAFRAARLASAASLRSRGNAASRTSSLLIGGQVALTLALLLVAGLLGESLRQLRSADAGVEPDGVLTFSVSLPSASYDSAAARLFMTSLFERVEAIPGVRSAGAISTLPLSGFGRQAGMVPLDGSTTESVTVDVAVVAHDYFATMGVRLLSGRLFEPGDEIRSDPALVVDERLAARFWPGEDPLGKQVQGFGMPAGTVVGVVEHVKNYGASAESREELYFSHANRSWVNMHIVVETEGDPLALVSAAREAVATLDPNVPIQRPRAMTEVVEATTRTDGLLALLSRAFSVIATLLAGMGLYGLLSYAVKRGAPEIGIRLALGATGRNIAGGVIGRALGLTLAGSLVGAAVGLSSALWLRGRLFGVSPLDPATLATAVGLLAAVAITAAAIPALRAVRVEPMRVLRDE